MDTQRAASNVATGRLRPGDLDAHIYRAAYGPADNFSGLVKERMAAAPPGWEDAGVETLLGVLSQRPALRNAMATSLKNFRYAARFGAKKSAPSSDAIAVP
jgi:hypothetical protein